MVWLHLHAALESSESRWWGHKGWGGGRTVVFNGDRVSIWEDEKILEILEMMTFAQQCEYA